MKFSFLTGLTLGWALSINAAEQATNRLTSIQRLAPENLKAAHEARLEFARQRKQLPSVGVYQDFRAVIHVHAEDADHTKGTRQQVLEAAKQTGVQVVMFTDHNGPKPETWRGLRDGVLFIAGEENGGAGLLRFPQWNASGQPRAEGELRFLSHIEERLEASTEGFAGMEICNRHTDANLDKGLQNQLAAALAHPEQWHQLVENFKAYPDEFFAAGVDYRAEIFAKWDKETAGKPFTGIAANDAHRNQIFNGQVFDPYEVSFRNLTTHILARELTEPDIVQSLRNGHAYVAHDWLCDPTGFVFGAANNLGVFNMGDSAPLLGTTRLIGITPLPAHLKLFRNGVVIEQTRGTNLTFKAAEAGTYRLEAWLDVAGEERPWIYSNPVYLKLPSIADLQLPSGELAENVKAVKDIVYRDGDATDSAKHKLDLYLPKSKERVPVFFFVHGGAWKSGDRSQYPSLGNRIAKEGIATVIPSYRLAPKHPHPAQIEDVAAAFKWTVEHIAEYGGDPKRIVLGGHSAGGHLASLLALDETQLKAHGLSQSNIRGVVTLSGVYDLTVGDGQSSVFGTDDQVRKKASPIHHLRPLALPFLVSYCEWDYATLPAQARQFHESLRKTGIAAELVYTRGESHISEMVHFSNNGDSTAAAVLKFIERFAR